MMPPTQLATLLICLTLLAGQSNAQAQESESDVSNDTAANNREQPTVSVRSFGRNKVIGLLEHPLGTVVRVQGMVVDGNSTRRRIDAGKTLLEIESVNGVKLKRPIAFNFQRAAEGITKPSPGQRFDYYVHEYGEFSGVVDIPEELGIEKAIVANDGFHYRRRIAIHKENSR